MSNKRKNEMAISVTGNQPFMGKDIPVVLGGFGPKARCICDKTVAEIHGMREVDVRRRITDNCKRFTNGVDYIDMAERVHQTHTLELLTDLGYSKQAITQAEHIYILSERGYAKLVKIMDTDQAWGIYEHLLDEYFLLREDKREQTKLQPPKLPPLSSINGAMKLSLPALEKAGVSPEFIALTVAETYRPYGIMIPQDCITVQERFMDQTEIAKMLGVLVASSGNPSARAIGGIIDEIGVADSEIKKAPFTKNGHSDAGDLYAESVIPRIIEWLEDHGYPLVIKGRDGKNQHVKYVATERLNTATTATYCGA